MDALECQNVPRGNGGAHTLSLFLKKGDFSPAEKQKVPSHLSTFQNMFNGLPRHYSLFHSLLPHVSSRHCTGFIRIRGRGSQTTKVLFFQVTKGSLSLSMCLNCGSCFSRRSRALQISFRDARVVGASDSPKAQFLSLPLQPVVRIMA